MAAEYRVELASPAGVVQAQITDYWDLAYTKRLGEPGLLKVALPGNHQARSLLALDSIVSVYRRNRALGIDWYADFVGLYRGEERRSQGKKDTFVMLCPGALHLLGRRSIAYRTDIANRSKFTNQPVETIMKTLVAYNAGAQATTANGRLRTPATLTITVPASSGAGTVLSWTCSFKNLLSQLKELRQLGGLEYRLDRTGPAAWTFTTFTPVDRTATVRFGLFYGNMTDPVYAHDRTNEATIVLVAGQGQKAARAVAIRTSSAYSAANDIEIMQDGRNETTTDELNAAGDSALADRTAKRSFDFKVVQTPGSAYGLHYCLNGALGDTVTAIYQDLTTIQQIMGVTVTVPRSGGEQIDPELEEVV